MTRHGDRVTAGGRRPGSPGAGCSAPGRPSCRPLAGRRSSWRDAEPATVRPGGRRRLRAGASCARGATSTCCSSTTGASDIGELAERLWYPIWDAGVKLGHAVRTAKEALALAADDLDTATSLLDVRHIAGDRGADRRAGGRATPQWRKRATRWLTRARRARGRARHAPGRRGRLPPRARPQGGPRRPARRARAALGRGARRDPAARADDGTLDEAYDAAARRAGRAAPRDRPARATVLAAAGAGRRGRPPSATRRRRADGARWPPPPARSPGPPTRRGTASTSSLAGPLGRGASRRDRSAPASCCATARSTSPPTPTWPPTRRCRCGPRPRRPSTGDPHRPGHASTGWRPRPPRLPDPWPAEARRGARRRCCWRGPPAIRVVEALDQRGLLDADAARVGAGALASRSATPTTASPSTGTCARRPPTPPRWPSGSTGPTCWCSARCSTTSARAPGRPHRGRHRAASSTIGPRMGFAAPRTSHVLVAMVRHHLLLPDVATRRDLDDRRTIRAVAEAVGRVDALAAAGRAHRGRLARHRAGGVEPTGRPGWSRELVARVRARAARAARPPTPPATGVPRRPSSAALMAAGRQRSSTDGRPTLTVVAPDRPGLFSRVAGVLALHGLDVLSADGRAPTRAWPLAAFRVQPSFGDRHRLGAGASPTSTGRSTGRLALAARLAERAAPTRGVRRRVAVPRPSPRCASTTTPSATRPSSRCTPPTRLGVLYRHHPGARRPRPRHPHGARSRPSATRSSTRSTSASADGAEGHRRGARWREVERALLHALSPSTGRRPGR